MSDLLDQLRALDPERDGSSGAPPLGWLRALLDAEPPPRRRPITGRCAPHPRQGRPVAVAIALACLAALALVAAVVFGGSSANPRRDALVPAVRAPVSGPAIVHVVIEARGRRGALVDMPGVYSPGRGAGIVSLERWSAIGGRWRERSTISGTGDHYEQSFAGGIQLTRRSDRGEVLPMHGTGSRQTGMGLGSRVMTLGLPNDITLMSTAPQQRDSGRALVAGVRDPRATIEAMVRRGDARPAGEVVRDGRRLLRYVSSAPEQRTAVGTRPGYEIRYLLDARDSTPVEITIATEYAIEVEGREKPLTTRSWTQLSFPVYELLPQTRRTELLLNLGGPVR